MQRHRKRIGLLLFAVVPFFGGCTNQDKPANMAAETELFSADRSVTEGAGVSVAPPLATRSGTPESAFREFNAAEVCVTFWEDWIIVESSGLPDHPSPYWAKGSELHIDPISAVAARMSPGTIRSRGYSLSVPADPQIADESYTTGLGAIGIATTGAPIFNDREGPTGSLSGGIASGFDYAGAHMGPTGYHYHMESEAAKGSLSHDDEKLVGVMQDGFLLYGRKCASSNTYPEDLDESGGHVCGTQHGASAFYHYHIINRTFVNDRILLFGADLKGTPYAISR